jgi:DNA-binding CsgD family transcriptional regulator
MLFGKLVSSLQEFGSFSQRALGKPDTAIKKKEFNLNEHLRFFHAFDRYFYSVADISSLKVVDAGGPIEQCVGYTREEVIRKGYRLMLKVHHLQDAIRSARGGSRYFKYLYDQPPANRPYIKVNRTLDLFRKDGRKIHVLTQSIPILFNDFMEPIYMLNIFSDITDLSVEKKYSHYIIDNSDELKPKRIELFKRDELPNYFLTSAISPAEKRVIALIADGKTSEEIANELFLSVHTVNTHRKNMLDKLNCENTAQLIKKAVISGWI